MDETQDRLTVMQAQIDLVKFARSIRRRMRDEILELAHEFVWREVLEWDEDPTDRNTIRARESIAMLWWLESRFM